jgi:hypothetical protein
VKPVSGRVAALAALAVATAAAPAVARAGSPQAALAARYAPVVRLVEQAEPCAHGEPFQPTDVRLLLGNPDIALRGPWGGTNLVDVAPTAADLGRGLWGYHLDFPGNALTPGCTYDRWSHRLNEERRPVTYAHVATDPGHPGRLALQYWFFYVFNDFNDKHEGDWEMIQLNFDAANASQALLTTPVLVGYSQHQGAESARWGESKLQLVGGTHPVVYAALGSHANYFTSALHLGRSAAEGVGCDDTSGPSRDVRPDVELVPSNRAAYRRTYPWLGFEGNWGEEHHGFYNGVSGPNTTDRWAHPLEWSEMTWRDKSFTVPVGNDVGRTATGFFCGAVAAGSTVLTALVGNPSPVLLGLALFLALLIWLASRTEWQPSAPLRLERRRAWGSILNAARRMYLGHLRLFLGIGLLFLPLGALVTGVQYLAFRAGGLNGLVEAAGRTNALVDSLAIGLGMLFLVVGLSVVQSATAIAMVEIDEGRRVTALGAYKQALPRLVSLLGAVVLVVVAVTVVSFTAIGALLVAWLVVRWSLLAQVHVLENRTGFSALRRSARLVRGNWWRVASLVLFVTLVALMLGPLCGTLLLFATHASFDFINLVAGVIDVIVVPYATIATTYLYFDLQLAKQTEPADEIVLPAQTAPGVPPVTG